MRKFEIILKNDRIKIYHGITLLLVILNVLFFIIFLFDKKKGKYALIFLIIFFIFSILKFFLKEYRKRMFSFNGFIFFLLVISWTALNEYLMAGLNLFFAMLYPLAVKKTVYNISEAAIKNQNFPWQTYSWSKFSNVVLKDNMLTIDFKSNRILQFEISECNTIDENEFNAFVREQLNHSAFLQK